MKTISITFTGTQEEIEEQIFAWRLTRSPRIDADLEKPIMAEERRSGCDGAKIDLPGYCALCCDRICDQRLPRKPAKCPRTEAIPDQDKYYPFGRSVSQQSHMESCAYCGKPVEEANGREFCSSRCQCLFVEKPTKAPKSNDLFQKEILPEPTQDERLKCLVAYYLAQGMEYPEILWSLRLHHDISLSPAGLAMILEDLA